MPWWLKKKKTVILSWVKRTEHTTQKIHEGEKILWRGFVVSELSCLRPFCVLTPNSYKYISQLSHSHSYLTLHFYVTYFTHYSTTIYLSIYIFHCISFPFTIHSSSCKFLFFFSFPSFKIDHNYPLFISCFFIHRCYHESFIHCCN